MSIRQIDPTCRGIQTKLGGAGYPLTRVNYSPTAGSQRSLAPTERFLPLFGVVKLNSRYIVHRHLGEMHIATRHVDAPSAGNAQRAKSSNAAALFGHLRYL